MEDALFDAVQMNNVELVKQLIGREVDVNIKTQTGESPLHYAVVRGHLACVEVRRSQFPLFFYGTHFATNSFIRC